MVKHPALYADVAQVEEYFFGKEEVRSANLRIGLFKGRGEHESDSRLRLMAVKRKPFIKFQCSECKRINYHIRKSRQKSGERKLELKKFCKWCKKKTIHKEGKR